MAHIAILNGPNLNMLGKREVDIYGNTTLKDIEKLCQDTAKELGHTIDFKQTNSEGELVTWIQESAGADALIINGAAYTHTSIAVYDALKILKIPVIEVHLSNIHARENFRHNSMISVVAKGSICGFGAEGYRLALLGLKID